VTKGSGKDYGLRLVHIVEACDNISGALYRVSPEQFLADKILIAAVERWFMILGEAAWKLPRLEQGQFPALPWQDIESLRHRLVHGYDVIDNRWLYRIAQENVPELVSRLRGQSLREKTLKEPDFPFPIKICGLSTPETMQAALDASADMVGLVFHRKSPRSVSLEAAAELATMARGKALVVALAVDPSDEGLDAITSIVKPDLLQLHGQETPARLDEITTRWETPIMKAVGVSETADLDTVATYRPYTDRLLLDAKPPKDAAYPGGHGKTFDWQVLSDIDPFMPFMLSGGLTPANVADAITTVRGLGITLSGVDVSSGVESAPGIKDVGKIRAFIENARSALP
jgi:phosphoribosylanthranilate isomerase